VRKILEVVGAFLPEIEVHDADEGLLFTILIPLPSFFQ